MGKSYVFFFVVVVVVIVVFIEFLVYISFSKMVREINIFTSITKEFYSLSVTLLKSVSVQFSKTVVSNSLRPHESQHARIPCPSATPGVHSNLCILSR